MKRVLGITTFLCCWDFELRSELKLNGESIGLRRYIVLLACAPVSETYREDCEKFWTFAKSGRDGFSTEEIATYISDIRKYIFFHAVRARRGAGRGM